MTLPTAEFVTNRYLYGKDEPPSNFLDPSIINITARDPINVDVNDYLLNGPGRFVTAKSFDFIENFFSSESILPGTYTKADIFKLLGIENSKNYVDFNNVFYGLDDEDYASRTYIWGTVAFAISDESIFIVNEDGSKHINNFSIVPLQNVTGNYKENFDFEGGTVTEIGNHILGLSDTVDPSHIGKTVIFDFIGEAKQYTLTESMFSNIVDPLSYRSIPLPHHINKFWELTDRLFESGSTRFIHEGKPIIYGDSGDNFLDQDIANYHRLDFSLSDHRYLGQYVKNGIIYVTGSGNDLVNATEWNDILLGNEGSDTLAANAGDDHLDGGAGDDILDGGEGLNTFDGGSGTGDRFLFNGAFGSGIITDFDGGTITINGSRLAVRRIDGEANTDGLFVFVGSDGKPASGKEDWLVSVSGQQVTVFARNAAGEMQAITADHFSWGDAATRYGIDFGEQLALPPDPAPTNTFTVGDGRSYWQAIQDHEGEDPFANRSIDYDAALYQYHYGVDVDDESNRVIGPLPAEDMQGPISYQFDGSNVADQLDGSHWYDQQLKMLGQDGRGYRPLYYRNHDQYNPDNWIGDVLSGLDGDDILTGDGKRTGETDYASYGDDDILVGGRGNDMLFGGGGDDTLIAWQNYLDAPYYPDVLPYDDEQYNDFVVALAHGDATIEQANEQNLLDGGDGNDVLSGASYDDRLLGGAGNDIIHAGAGCDTIAGGADNDFVYGDSFSAMASNGAYTRDFIAPDRLPEAGDYSRAYFYRAGADMDDLFDPDTAYNDVIDGGAGSDYLYGEIGHDRIAGGAGDDWVFGDRPYSAGHFVTSYKGFQPLSSRYHGDDVLDGGSGHDRLVGGGGADSLVGGDGNDAMYGDVGLGVHDFKPDQAIPGDPATAIRASDDGWWGNDTLLGGAGNDTLVGEGADDLLDGGDGSDLLWGDWTGSQGDAVIDSGAHMGKDTLYGRGGNDQLVGGGNDDQLFGGSGNDVLVGDSVDADGKRTGSGDDRLYGDSGDDFLYGAGGSDWLHGGSGNDFLDGGDDDDTYVYIPGDGVDTLRDYDGLSTLQLSVAPAGLVYNGNQYALWMTADGSQRVSMDTATFTRLKVQVGGSDHELAINLADYNPAGGNVYGSAGNDRYIIGDNLVTPYAIYDDGGQNTIETADSWHHDGKMDVSIIQTPGGTTRYRLTNTVDSNARIEWTTSGWDAIATVIGSNQQVLDVRLAGNSDNNVLEGKDGNDELYGDAGYDIIDGGNGNDILDDDAGCDVLVGGDGDDILRDTGTEAWSESDWRRRYSRDELYGGAGNDTLYAGDDLDKLYGGSGNDLLFGEGGDDQLHGDEGDDTLDGGSGYDELYGGDGNDIFLANDYQQQDLFVGGNGADTFLLSAGGRFHIADDVDVYDGDRLLVDATPGQLYIDSFGLEIRSADDSNLTLARADWSDSDPEHFDWQRLEDFTIELTDGTVIDTATIRDRVFAGTQYDDRIIGDSTANTLRGQAGSDSIWGLGGADIIDGGAGNDELHGGAGDDTFHFAAGYGNDIIVESGWHLDRDTITLGSTVTESNLKLVASSSEGVADDLLLRIRSTGETLTLDGFLSPDGNRTRQQAIQFANGNRWDMARLEQELFRHSSGLSTYGTPTAGNDTINGSSVSNYIFGAAGDDRLNGYGGNDWLDGGSGNDQLTGGAGSDTFRFGAGSGHDQIMDATSLDQLRLDFNTAVGDLTLQLTPGNSQWLLGRHDAQGNISDSIRFSNTLGRIVDVAGNDLAVATRANGSALGLLEAANGQLLHSTLTLAQHATDDRYVMLAAADLLGDAFTAAEKSRWQIVGATPAAAGFGIDDADIDGDGDAREQAFFFVENLFGDGINRVAFLPAALEGSTSFRYTLRRDDGLTLVADMAVSQISSTSIRGTDASDFIDGSQADTALLIEGLGGDDRLRDGYGDDVLRGGDGNDVLSHNWAGNGNDVYYGEAGNDVLDAGWGSDTLVGGSGHDLYIEANLWSGDHTVIDNTSAAAGDIDTLQIDADGYGMWDYRSLWFRQDGDDLLITQLDALEHGEIRVQGWFDAANPEARLDVVRVQQDDGAVYEARMNAQFDNLVQAMAGFAPPASVASIDPSLADEYQAAWQLVTPAAA